ncbi:MAG TPA: oxidoreductase [Hypericibacter adhaerens]|uniref:oxidoreductase n=1 Tax=Hypericibacter adhaerens TaxID=2602016 RepID=UPI002CC61906|nr:oxidoreductase [Hypericibacter adhaerens]HWA45441.1 oxidoreductase [Hypericibacter adhaerens]
MSAQAPLTFLITGVSSGLGRALAEAALAAGHRVAGTLRDEAARAAFDSLAPGRSLGLRLDVTDNDAIAPAVAAVEATLGPIDVLVNNAGYGHEGILEESSLADLRRQFEVNVFAPVAMIQAVLPSMRRRRSGHIVNITSMGGLITFPGIGFYNGSKFALEGLSESLGKEVKDLGIRVTAVEPGQFRTDWAGRSMVRAERKIADYDAVFEPLRSHRREVSGRQIGDPAKAAQAILTLVKSDNPPAHLPLGPDALKLIREKLDYLQGEIAAWEKLTLSTSFG